MREKSGIGRIIDVDRHRDYLDAMPRGKDKEFEFCLVARGEQREPAQLLERIEAEARLRVLEAVSCLNGKPEVGEGIGELASLAAFSLLESLAPTYDEGARMLLVGMKHRWDVLGEVLAVSIEGDGVGKAHLQRLLEATLQGCAFAGIPVIADNCDALDALQDTERLVSAAISHNNHVEAMRHDTTHHIGDGSRIVESGNHHADASRAKCLLDVHHTSSFLPLTSCLSVCHATL